MGISCLNVSLDMGSLKLHEKRERIVKILKFMLEEMFCQVI